MNAAVLVLTVALADLVVYAWCVMRWRVGAAILPALASVAWLGVLIAGVGYSWLIGGVFVAVGAAWAWAFTTSMASKIVIPLSAALVAAVVTLLMVASGEAPAGPGLRQWTHLKPAVPLEVVVTVIAVALFLAHTANNIVRAVLTLARRNDGRTPAPRVSPTSAAWTLVGRWRWMHMRVVPPGSVQPPVVSTMRGGRWIGPLERWAIVALGIAGVPAIIAALMAGKGIIRFPEINADRGLGSKAEEFLVGSMLSWILAGAGIALIFAVTAIAR